MLRRQIAFYGSTPAYGDVLRLHGWGTLHEDLHRLSVTGDPQRWDRMSGLIDDEVLSAFAVIGPLREVCAELGARFGGDVDQVRLNPPPGTTAEEITAARLLLDGTGVATGR
jgi:hypothetical protein